MKKVIKGKTYNTRTAVLIATATRKLASPHPYHQCEVLYRTESREYFIHGSGGSMTRYSKFHNKKRHPGDPGIRPVTKQQKDYWLKSKKNRNYSFIGEMISDSKKTV